MMGRSHAAEPLMPKMGVAGFWKRVDTQGPDDCWLWTGDRTSNGYGSVHLPNGSRTGAHRVSYALTTGHDPGELHVCHRCDIRDCVNPAHLFLGTQKDNMKDASLKGRATARKKVSGEQIIQIKELWKQGKISREIGDLYGISQTQAYRLATGQSQRRSAGHVGDSPWRTRGMRNHAQLLTDDQVQEIRSRYAAGGVTQRMLAAEFGVGQPHISYLVRRLERRDVV